jgi:hypothetical protein
MFRKQNSGLFSPKSPDCLPDGSGGHIRIDRTAARPVGQSPTSTNAHDPVTSERGGLSPYRAVETWLLLLYGHEHNVNTRLVHKKLVGLESLDRYDVTHNEVNLTTGL